MKKIICFFIIMTVTYSCCYTDTKRTIITDFSKITYDSIVPCKENFFNSYTTRYGHIRGYSNDTVIIKFGKSNETLHFLINRIDTIFKFDYYGHFNQEHYPLFLTFDPYKATEGRIEIEHKLL